MDGAGADTELALAVEPEPGGVWRRRRWWLVGGAVLAGAGLAAGLIVWRDSGSESVGRKPFASALVRLSAQPAMRYRTGGGGLVFDAQVTYGGSVLGTVDFAGARMQLLTVGGKTYVKMPDSLLAGSGGSSDPTGLAGKWITGGGGAAAAGVNSASSQLQTPAKFAQKLLEALNSKQTVLPKDDAPAADVDGVAALKASTPAGDLYVSKDAPHRLLRVAPRTAGTNAPSIPPMPSLPSLPSMPSLPSGMPSMPAIPSLPSAFGLGSGAHTAQPASFVRSRAAGTLQRWRAAVAAAPSLGTVDVGSLSQQDVDELFDDLVRNTKQLDKAVDSDIQFRLNGSADLS
ncbi:hypothetical protein ACWD25_48165, partial [Streptomyces sp. NPDC002920]